MSSVLIYLGVVAVLIIAVFFLCRDARSKRVLLILTGVTIALEVFVFNMGSYRLMFGKYEKTEVDLQAENVVFSGGTQNDGTLSNSDGSTLTIEMQNVGKRVSTVYFDVDYFPRVSEEETGSAKIVTVNADVSDVTNAVGYRYGIASAKLISGNMHSQFLKLNQSGEVSAIRLRLQAGEGETFRIRGVTLNKMIVPQFSVFRSLAIVLIGYCLFVLFTSPFYLKKNNEDKRPLRYAAVFMVVLFSGLGIASTLASSYDRNGSIEDGNGGQITQEIVDAFSKGQVSLLDPVEEDLLKLENPYDWSERIDAGVSYKWDHLLFNGKYYSYYGIAPVLLLFLPYHLITGKYFEALPAVLLFSILGVLFLTLFFLRFAEDYFGELPNNMLIGALLTLLMASGIWYCFPYTNFYEIAQSAGFMFVAAGAYFMLKANVLGERPIRYRYVVLSTASLAFAVLSRPTLALYSVVALIFLGYGFVKQVRTISGQTEKKGKALIRPMLPYLFSAVTSFAVLGGVQMLYNHLRFGSFFDFGIQYSLTINDFTKSEFHLGFMLIGLYNFLVAAPHMQTEFPFVSSNFSQLGVNGYYFVANTNAVGLFFRAFPMFSYFALPVALRSLSKKEKKDLLLLALPLCVIAPLIIICSIWESGYGVRYSADFNWELLLGAFIIINILYTRVADKQIRAFLSGACILSGFLSAYVNFALIYSYMDIGNTFAASAATFEQIFNFWM